MNFDGVIIRVCILYVCAIPCCTHSALSVSFVRSHHVCGAFVQSTHSRGAHSACSTSWRFLIVC